MIRIAGFAAVSILCAASAARADVSPPAVPSAAPAWLLQYTALASRGRIRVTRYVSTRADGRLTWQQLDVDTGIADNGPMHRCTGSAQLAGEEQQAMEDAAKALEERHAGASPSPADGRGSVAVALIVPRANGSTEVSSLNFDPSVSGAEPRLKRAAAILSRYRCPN